MLKKGDVKVNSEDLVELIGAINEYQFIINNNLQILDKEDEKTVQQCSEIYDRFMTKYVRVADCRRREHLWFQVLKIIDNFQPKENHTGEVNLESLTVDDLMSFLNDMIDESCELWDNTESFVGTFIQVYGADEIRRRVFANYIEQKTAREQYQKEAEKKLAEK